MNYETILILYSIVRQLEFIYRNPFFKSSFFIPAILDSIGLVTLVGAMHFWIIRLNSKIFWRTISHLLLTYKHARVLIYLFYFV